jgi:hypothetical protein
MTSRNKPLVDPEHDLCRRRLKALAQASIYPGTAAKRFVRNLEDVHPRDMSARQRMVVEQLAWRFRRQLDADLVPTTKPAPMRPKRMPAGQGMTEVMEKALL